MKSYTIATSSSILIALASRKLIEPWSKHMTGIKLIMANTATSFLAVAAAGYLNTYAMRMKELETGIHVMDK